MGASRFAVGCIEAKQRLQESVEGLFYANDLDKLQESGEDVLTVGDLRCILYMVDNFNIGREMLSDEERYPVPASAAPRD